MDNENDILPVWIRFWNNCCRKLKRKSWGAVQKGARCWWRSCWGTALEVWRSRVLLPMVWRIFHWHNPSGRTMALGL